jgi:integrase
VILAPALATALRQHWLASRHKRLSDFVFTNPSGRALNYRHLGDAFRRAVKAAGLHAPGKLILHSLRHTFASFLIASGLDVVFVRRQLGHAHPGITLQVYSHLFAARDHAATAHEALDASHTAVNGAGRPQGRRCSNGGGNSGR